MTVICCVPPELLTGEVNVRVDALATSIGLLLTTMLTGIVSGLLMAELPVAGFVAVTVIVPVHVAPAVRLLRLDGVKMNDPLVVPVVWLNASQFTLLQFVSVDVTV